MSPATLAALNQALPCPWSRANPIDILGDADSGRYARALTILRGDPGLDAVLALHCPFAGVNSAAIARALIAADTGSERGLTRAPTLMARARRLLAASHLPSYDTPERAIRAFMHLVAYRHAQVQLMETPPALPEDCRPDLGRIRPLLLRAQDDGREWLTEPEAKAVLSACGIPVVATLVAQTPDQAATLAREIGGPVALKLLSPDIPHKRRAGGVALELTGPQAVRAAALAMLERIRQTLPKARIDGFSVQEMVRRPEACELILGLSEDPQFGPVLLVGQGGSGAEALRDTALGLPRSPRSWNWMSIPCWRTATASWPWTPASDSAPGRLLASSDSPSSPTPGNWRRRSPCPTAAAFGCVPSSPRMNPLSRSTLAASSRRRSPGALWPP